MVRRVGGGETLLLNDLAPPHCSGRVCFGVQVEDAPDVEQINLAERLAGLSPVQACKGSPLNVAFLEIG
jgi:hypothetical protein